MGKGKGCQSGGFARKSLRAQFRREWQEHVSEDVHKRSATKKEYSKTIAQNSAEKSRPKFQLGSLLRILEERQYHDQVEDRATRQKKSIVANRRLLPPPGSVVYCNDSEYGKDVRVEANSLQKLCLKSLATSLPIYMEQFGEETLYHYLSLLTGPALTALSVYISESIGMSNSLVGLLNQSHVTRLSIFAPKYDEETDKDWKAFTKHGLESLVPTWGYPSSDFVREHWEDYSLGDDEEDLWEWKGCRRLERLELGNMTYLPADSIKKLLETCSSLTHLSLNSCCTFESGPEVLWQLHEWLPRLTFLDLSGNAWVTEELLRKLFLIYCQSYSQVLQVKAVGCLTQTSKISLELDFGNQFICK